MAYTLVFLGVIIFDQLTKITAAFFDFPFVCNRGIAFGLGPKLWFFSAILAAILVFLCFFLFARFKNRLIKMALVLIAAGGFSNLVDRLTLSCVRDFIDLKFWPSFNLADTAITIGVILLAYSIFFKKEQV